ncbi:MAG: hypothetical protein K6G83_10560 [Lachnospiraceae bacterium]|nr:hypothetical protein [Lachnospiraceae bacterium]
MKNKLIKTLLLISIVSLVTFTGCGSSKASESPASFDEEDMASEWNEDEDEDFDEDEDDEEKWDEDEDEDEEDFFDSHGLELSEPGTVTFSTAINDGEKDTGEIEIDATVEYLGESIEDDDITDLPEDYKVVKAVFTYDLSKSERKAGILADGAFDRYTGISFDFDRENDDLPYYDQTQEYDDLEYGYIRLETPDGDYDITLNQELVVDYPKLTKTFWVICPNDYDGTVFYVGYADKKLSDKYDNMGLSDRLYTMDELPWFDNGHDYYYFSMDRLASVKPDSEEGDEDWGEDEDKDDSKDKSKDKSNDKSKGGDEVVEKSYTEKEILELAKTLSGAPNAELDGVDPDGTYNIHLYGKNSQDTWDWYFIDPKSLEGTNVLGDKIDLKGAIQQ